MSWRRIDTGVPAAAAQPMTPSDVAPNDHGDSVAVQPDGTILLVHQQGKTTVATRYESDGTLDRDFGSNGLERSGPSRAPSERIGLHR
jgi:hypothetical protein